MYVVIVGGGKVGSHLAHEVVASGHTCTLIEKDAIRCEVLDESLSEFRVICGDGDEPYVLDDADARSCDALVAATGHDEDNLVVCLLGKIEYEVPLTVARINNPSNSWLFTEQFGVDVPVSNTAIMTEVLKKVSLGDIVTLLKLQAEGAVIDELVLSRDARSVGKSLSELDLPSGGQVMAILREGTVVVPRGDTVLKAGDELLILARREDDEGLRRAFGIDT